MQGHYIRSKQGPSYICSSVACCICLCLHCCIDILPTSRLAVIYPEPNFKLRLLPAYQDMIQAILNSGRGGGDEKRQVPWGESHRDLQSLPLLRKFASCALHGVAQEQHATTQSVAYIRTEVLTKVSFCVASQHA